jgi:uncharacterized protein (TIGR02246 family)
MTYGLRRNRQAARTFFSDQPRLTTFKKREVPPEPIIHLEDAMPATAMPETVASENEDLQIRQQIESLVRALRAKDIDALMAHYAPDVVTFDLRPPPQIQGANAYRKNFEAWFASVRGSIDYETRDLSTTVRGDVAFCHSLNHVKSTRTTGERADYWVRVTSGLRKINGRWLIAHEHVSMPIDMATMQASPGGP